MNLLKKAKSIVAPKGPRKQAAVMLVKPKPLFLSVMMLVMLHACATPTMKPSANDASSVAQNETAAGEAADSAQIVSGSTGDVSGAEEDLEADAPDPLNATTVAATEPPEKESLIESLPETKIVRFEWRPTDEFHGSYSLSDAADQHRVVFPKGLEKGNTYPVVIAFHGQPKRGKDPRNYMFMEPVQKLVLQMIADGDIEPVILVMPVFRFLGTNWPKFNPKVFQKKVTELLAEEGVTPGDWYAFGHSGAAGCGGNGLNQVHTMAPKGVGFFDTCLGKDWQREVKTLQKAGVKTFNIHSVETAGFKPRQRPEYQADFDFGRAYSPLGIEPVDCPSVHPGKKLRSLPYRCSATKDGVVQSFVIDTGEGVEAHKAVLAPAISFFLKYFLKKKSN